MNILIIKTSSLGDVIHCLPAIYDLKENYPDAKIDWVVEKSFADIAKTAPIDQVIHVEFRKWRKSGIKMFFLSEYKAFKKKIQQKNYDIIIDAQGLLKSVFLAKQARGKRVGFDRHSIREKPASLFYQEKLSINKNKHAIKRLRELFAKSLHYPIPKTKPLFFPNLAKVPKDKHILLLHGTTWESKHYPIAKWRNLCQKLGEENYRIYMTYGNESEQQAAEKIADNLEHVIIIDKMPIAKLIELFLQMQAIISVDTGLAHLADALNIPVIGLYGPTNPLLTGLQNQYSQNLFGEYYCAPCLLKQCQRKTADNESKCLTNISTKTILNQLQNYESIL